MYKCGVCSGISAAGEPRKTFTVFRPGTRETEREVPVCTGCAEKIAAGVSYRTLIDEHRPAAKHQTVFLPPVKVQAPATVFSPPPPRRVTFGGNGPNPQNVGK